MVSAAMEQPGRHRLLVIAPGLFWLCSLCIVAAIILGGGTRQGLWSDALLQILSLVLLAVSIMSLSGAAFVQLRWPLLLIAGIVVLPLMQLMPLPPEIWAALPGRSQFAVAYREVGILIPWLPVSLDPAATWRAALSLIPPTAVFLATVQLGLRARRSLTLLFGAVVVLSVVLGLAQVMQGPSSGLRLFAATNQADSVGFFSNRNHYAALLYSVIPLAAAWIVGLTEDRRPERYLAIAAGMLLFIAIIIGLAIARSRAGILLAGFVSIGGLLIVLRPGGHTGRKGAIAVGVAIVIGVSLAVHFAFFSVAARFEDGILDGYRMSIAATTLQAAQAFQPTGSGLGTFAAIYQMFEPTPAILTSYVNHAHNDWIELVLEGGWIAVVLLLAFIAWFATSTVRVWSHRPLKGAGVLDEGVARASTVVIAGLLFHSAVDYPLRTSVLMVLLAFCCALLVAPVPPRGPQRYLPASGAMSWFERLNQRRSQRRAASWTTRG